MLPIERRLSLKLTVGAFFALVDSLPSLAHASTTNGGQKLTRINWDQFVNEIEGLSHSHTLGHLPSPVFVSRVAATGARLNLEDQSLISAYNFLEKRKQSTRSPMILAEVTHRIAFDIVLLTLDQGYSIPLHDHPDRSVVSVCAIGETAVQNYDLHKSADISTLKLRSRTTIRPYHSGSLTESEGNVHTLTATLKTQLIDIVSPAAPPEGWFHWIKTEPRSPDGSLLRVISMS